MGLFNRLFGRSQRDTFATTDAIDVAAGRGFTFNIVGESQFQPALSKLCGGKKVGGHKREATAQLRFEQNTHDPNAIAVYIRSKQVGWIPAVLTQDLRREVIALNADQTVACKAMIMGGWKDEDGEGHFGVKLSLSRPLKIASRA